MRRNDDNSKRMRRQLLRLAGVVACVAAFVGVATLINPTSSLARAVRNASGFPLANGKPGAGLPAAAQTDRLSLGTLEGHEFRVSIFAASDHPSYSVVNAAGQAVALDVPADEVYKHVPEMDVRSMMADVEVDSAY